MIKAYSILLFLLIFIACNKNPDIITPEYDHSHIAYFGFTLIDTYWDDPTDEIEKTNYTDEVEGFTNIADIIAAYPEHDLRPNMENMDDHKLKVLIHLNEIFFEIEGTDSESGADYKLREDYVERWRTFSELNEIEARQDIIAAFYIGEEPTWNGITFDEIKQVSDLLEEEFPEIPTLLIEAFPALPDLITPPTVDWIGFDHYFIKSPTSNPDFIAEWELLKSKKSSADQKLVVIMDSHYIDWAHGDFGKIELEEMDDVATSYYDLAKSDTSVVAMLGYFWPNGFDAEGSVGARGMPDHVQEKYRKIGEEIIK